MPLDDATAPYEEMSVAHLAMQPSSIDTPQKPLDNWGVIFGHLESRFNAMRMWRWSWWAYWAQLARFILPERYKWLVTANTMSRGRPLNNAIIDGTGTQAMEVCASGLWTGLTSPSRPWFELDKALEWVEIDADGQDWLEDTTKRVYTVFNQSNFYTVMAQAFRDVATFGTAPVTIYEDAEEVIRLYNPCAGEYYLAVGARLSVDTQYDECTRTVAQIVDMFTLEACPPEIREAWRTGGGSLEMEFVVCHAIEPNFALAGIDGRKNITVVPGGFAYREVHWLKGNQTAAPLSKRGFWERPFMVARWSTVSNDPYGRSPGMKALGDIKQLQVETVRKGEFIEKLIRPPMGADPDLQNQPYSILPGETTYVRSDGQKKGFWPLFEVAPAALSPLVQDLDKIGQRIEKYFFVDIFMAISRMEGVQPRNELELTKRDLERLQVLGPFVTMFENEFAGPAIQRTLAIMQRRGMLRPMPPSLRGVPLKIAYTSILRLAQQAAEAVSMKDFFQTAGALSSAAKAAGVPDPIRTVNLDKALRRYGEVSNFDTDLMFTDDEVQQHDAARAKAQQQAQTPANAMAAVTAAKTLSDTQLPGGNSALGALMGGGGGGTVQ